MPQDKTRRLTGDQLEVIHNSTSYEFDYFSGAQIGVYFGDLLVDDIVSINYSVNQSKMPIYSYGEQYYHSVAAGQVIVQGTFTIPFKETAYIPLALANYQYKLGRISGKENSQISPISWGKRRAHNVAQQNIERTLRDTTGIDKYTMYRDLSALPDDVWEDVAENYEDVLWKRRDDSQYDSPNCQQTWSDLPPKPDDEFWQQYRRADQFPPFDIWILYGDISNKAANHTIRKIIQCDIIGQAQEIQANGEPILEQYEFIARTLG